MFRNESFRLILLFISVFVLFILSLMLGSDIISLTEVFKYFLNPSSSAYTFTLEVLRMPRALLSITSGLLLGISGLMLQSALKNPIASPDIIGITGGAALGAVMYITSFSALGFMFMPVFSVIGAFTAMLLLFVLNGNKIISTSTIVIIGIALQAIMMSIVNLLIITGSQFNATTAYQWLVGSLYGAKIESVYIQLIVLVAMLPVMIYIIPKMKIAQLDDEAAIGLGLKVNQLKVLQLICVSVAVGFAVCFVGSIGFVGLIAPHIASRIIKSSMYKKIIASGFIAALCILTADLIGRTLFLPHEVSAGVFIAAFGAPFFLYLLLTIKKI